MATFKISDIPLVDSNPAETFTPAPTQADVPTVPVIGIPQSSAPPPAMLDTFGQSPWVDEDKDYNQALNDWYRSGQEAVDNAVFDPDKAFKGMNLDFEADPETAKRTLINESWMELNHDEPLAPTELQRAVQMQVASLAKFNEMVSTPEDLYKLIKKDAGKRKDAKDLFRGLGTDAAKAATISAFGEAGQTYQAWRETVKGKPGYDPINEADYFEAWHDAKQQMNESLAPYRAEVTEVWNGWKESTGAGKVVGVASGLIQDAFLGGMGETDAALAKKSTRRTAFDIYDKLTDEEKPKFMEALGVLAANVPKAEKPLFFANIGKQSGRDIESLVQNAGTATVDFMMNPEMWDTSSGSTGKPTEYRRQADFVQRLQNLQEGTYDPVQKVSDSWIGKLGETVAYGTAGVVATSVSAMNPYTATALFASLTENHYQSLLNAQMEAGVSYDKASAYATNHAFVGAAVETASEMVGSRLLRGQLPFFDQALTRAMDKIKNPLLRGGTRFLAGGIESGVQEVGQNYIDPSIRGLSAAFGEDTGTIVMPGAQENIESFVSVLPLALMGIPGAAGRDARVKAFAAATDLQMAAVGYTAESVQAIRTGIALGLDSGAAAIDQQVRTPETPEAIAAQEALKAQLASARQALEQLKNLGYAPPTFSVTPEGIFVFDGEGKELGIAPDWDQAQRIAGAHTGALENLSRERQDVLQTLFTATAAAAKLDPSSITEVDLGDFDPSKATPGGAVNYAQQVAMKEKAAGGTGKITYSVFGYSVTSFAEGLRTTINRLFDGAAVTDVFHETTHGLRRAGHKAGTLTKGMEISLLMNHDLVSGNRRARDEKGKKTGEPLRFIPEGITAEMMETGQIPADMIPAEFNGDGARYAEKLLDEGISEMVEVEVLKLRKGEGKGKLGITRADIRLNLRSLAKINSETAGSWTSFFAAVRARWGLTLSRAILFMRAEKNGEFDPAERDAYLDKLLGLDQQTEHDAGVMAEFDAMFGPEKGKVAEDDIPFSIGRATVTTTPETQTFQGAEGSPSVIGPASFSIGAFHGTPHKVDKFSTAKIGTGEGAQAFGWGLYFAKAKAVAEEYRKGLSSFVAVDGKPIHQNNKNVGTTGDSGLDDLLIANMGDLDAAIKDAQDGLEDYIPKLEALRGRVDISTNGNLYTVNLDVNDEDLLDLDKPLSGQNQAIRDILLPIIKAQQAKFPTLIPAGFDIERLAGGGLLNVMGRDESDSLGTDKDASMRLLAAGIPGIRYLDGNSRNSFTGWKIIAPESEGGMWTIKSSDPNAMFFEAETEAEAEKALKSLEPQSHNYVIFDESKIQITEENGTAVEIGGNPLSTESSVSFSIGSVHPELKTTAPGDALPEGLKLAPVADSTSSANINRQFENLDAIFEALPNPLATTSSWVTFMRALGNSLGKTTPVPIAPERAIGYANGQGFDHIMVDLKAHPEYVAARVQGLEVGTRILAGFRDESLKRADLGSLFIWGLLSRGIGAYPQEGAFSAIHRAGLIDQLERVFAGDMTPVELRDWALTAAKGSPMGGAFRNVKAIDQMVQAMMFQIDKKPAIDHLLDLWKSDLSGPQLRREVYRMFTNDRPSIQIQNKVLSFIILVSGRPDVMVLDRVQFRHLWGGSALDGIIANLAEKLQVAKDATLKLRNITKGSAKYKATQDVNTDASNTYDALPVVVSKAEEDRSIEGEAELKAFGQFWAVVLNFTRGKRAGTFDFQKVAGKLKVKRTGLVGLGNGLHGLATYEAIERSMAAQLVTAYQDAGIAYPGVGAFHWDSWLVSSRQAISHPTLDLIAGNKSPGLSVMEGKFNTINYGMLFRYDGQYMRESLTVPGLYVMLTPEAAAKDYTTAAVNKAIGRKGKNQLKLKNAEETDEDGPKERTRPWTEDLTDAERLAFDQWLDTIGTAVQPDPANGTDGRADGGRDAGLDDVQDGAVDSSLEEVGPSFSIGGVKAGGFEKAKAEGRTFTGKDGKERFELDASKAAFNPSGIKDPAHRNGFKRLGDDSPIGWLVPDGMDTPLGNILAFDELYENYPELAGLKVNLHHGDPSTFGSFARVEINGKISLGFSTIYLSDKLTAGRAFSTLLHEVQHAIQQVEGFAPGSSPEAETKEYNRLRARVNGIHSSDEMREYERKTEEVFQKYDRNEITAEEMYATIEALGKTDPAYKELLQVTEQLQSMSHGLGEFNAHRAYRNRPGEKEARGVQARQSMTAEERATTPFMDQYPSFSIGKAGDYQKGGDWYHGGPEALDGGKLKTGGKSGWDSGGIFLSDDSNEGKRYAAGYGRALYRVQVDLENDEVFNLANPEHRARAAKVETEDAIGTDFLRNAETSVREGSLDWSAIDVEVLTEAGFKGAILMERPAGFLGENPIRSLSVFDPESIGKPVQVPQEEYAAIQREAMEAAAKWDGNVSLSIGPAKVAGILSDNALARITDPRRRTYVMSKISRDFNAMRLQIERISSLAGIRRSKGDLSREAMAREDLAAEEKIAAIHARFGSLLADEDLVKIKSQPVHAHLADPDTPLRGRLKSKAAAIKSNPERYQLHRAGDYDGSDGVSRSVFGGQNMPDQAAQELFDEGLIKEPTADAMWEALLAEQNTVAGMKEMLLKAKEQIRQAKQEAKQEANEWLATQSKDQEVNFSDKEEIRRALRMLDAILLALPAEIRGKIGGYTQISMITSDEARLAYLQDKLAKADKELETFLRVEYAKEWEELLKKAAPKTNEAGQRPTGSIAADAYDVFRVAEWAMGQSFALGEAEADKWDAIADNPETEIPEADLARVKAQMIRLTTNWNAADAARREQAVLEGDKIYFGGLRALAIDNSRRRERLGKLRTSAIKGTGKTGARMEREAAKQAAASKGGVFREMSWEFLSFGQLVNVLFGEKSDVAKWFNAREIAASNAAHDGFQAKANSLESLFDTLSGNRFDGEKLRHRMATAQTIKVTDALGVQQSLSDSQAITFLLMWRQEDGRRHMEGIIDEQTGAVISTWGWDEDSAADIEKQLSREGRAVMSFLASSYGEEYDRINEVFRKIWNVSMPRHKMYAPLSVNPVQGKGDTIMDPVSGDTMGAGMTPGSLKNRSFSAIAEPELKDAFQVFLTHARQMEHFIAYGEFSRDALGVINRRETRSAILAAGGPTAAGTLSKWIDYFALGGLQDASMGSKWGRVMGGMLGRISQAALVGRVSVLAMQSLQLAAASFKMPLGSFLTRFAKLSTGQLGWNDAINSEYIQRRVSQMPPLVRDMLAGIASGTPNRAKYLAGILGQTISGADALFTAGTYAIFYDYHLKIAKAAKAENPEAVAHKEAERLTDQVAQPTRTGARSWLEVANQGNPAFRAMWNFSSDPRQKASLIVYEAMRRDTSGLDKAGNVAFMTAKVWIIGGILATLLRTIIRDLRSDDDDEIFDERYWSPSRLALMAFTGPLSAVPYLGGMVEASTYAATGQFMPKGGMLNFMESAASIPAKWAKGKVEPLKDLETLATAGAGLSGTSAAAASVMHIIRDLVGFIENLEGPD